MSAPREAPAEEIGAESVAIFATNIEGFQVAADAAELFNYLTGYSKQVAYRKLLVAPRALRAALLAEIEREKSEPGRVTNFGASLMAALSSPNKPAKSAR